MARGRQRFAGLPLQGRVPAYFLDPSFACRASAFRSSPLAWHTSAATCGRSNERSNGAESRRDAGRSNACMRPLLGAQVEVPGDRFGSGPGGRPSQKPSVGELSRAFRSTSDRAEGCNGHRKGKVASDRFRFVPSFNARPRSGTRSLIQAFGQSGGSAAVAAVASRIQ